jgi:hypothetical protein
VSSGSTARINVLIVSQPPVVDATVSITCPAAVNTWPFQVYGNWFAQTLRFCVEVIKGLMVIEVEQVSVVHPFVTVHVIVDTPTL